MTTTQNATARRMLRILGAHLAARADDPAADVLTLVKQAEQTAGLVRAEVKSITTVTQHDSHAEAAGS